jgi:hypothetical protein
MPSDQENPKTLPIVITTIWLLCQPRLCTGFLSNRHLREGIANAFTFAHDHTALQGAVVAMHRQYNGGAAGIRLAAAVGPPSPAALLVKSSFASEMAKCVPLA